MLGKLELVETKKEGIFVMPKERIELLSASIMYADDEGTLFATLEEMNADGVAVAPAGVAGVKPTRINPKKRTKREEVEL